MIISVCEIHAQKITDAQVEEALEHLDMEISKRHEYISKKQHHIDSLRTLMNRVSTDMDRLNVIMEIGETYCAFDNDSALIYFTRGYDSAKDFGFEETATKFRILRATYLPLCGFIAESLDEFDAIDPEKIEDGLKTVYYESGKQLYSYIASFFSHYEGPNKYWLDKSKRFASELLGMQNSDSEVYRLNYGELLYENGDLTKAKSILMDLIDELPADSNLYARACHMLASIARMKGNDNEAKYYLARSAIADIRGAVLEVMSLQELGVMMSEEGDIDRAYNYLSVALTNAVECNASMRIMQTSTALPIIQRTHNDQIRQWRHRIYFIIFILLVILITLGVVLLLLRRQMRRMSELQERLRGANQVKEVYISQFFRLCSIYIDKLNQFCKIANRKISSGQVDELYKITKSGKLVEDQSREFYQLFDDAFLHIYPTFVEDVNALLREKIILKKGELLNNDLRILAFLRLGLEDTNQVAQILNYSVNTIYAYRNKLRNRAYDRENFEKEIMKISSI